MKRTNSLFRTVAVLTLAGSLGVSAATHYVWQGSPNPKAPYTNWATATHIIQNAVDVSVAGDEIVVTNGVYATGGRAVYGIMTNRVAVDRAVTVRSVNGPEVTAIQGYQVPWQQTGNDAVRCVYLTNGAVLSGFTLTNGGTAYGYDKDLIREQSGGGLWCESACAVVTNSILVSNSASYYAGGAFCGTLNNCTLIGNSAYEGGGAYAGTLNHCSVTGNSASERGGGSCNGELHDCQLADNSAYRGGGAADGTLYGCNLTGNTARSSGGGSYQATLDQCTLTDNSASFGGGASGGTLNNCILTQNSASCGGGVGRSIVGWEASTLNNCTLIGNSAQDWGGGAYRAHLNNCALAGNSASRSGGGACASTLNNCTLTGNSASNSGGGACGSTLNNCTLTSNSASRSGGGSDSGTLNNCISYYNTAPAEANYTSCEINYSCTTPLPTYGLGNITNEPALASASHLSADSPCRGAGNAACAGGVDIDGEAWLSPPAMGCDEYRGAPLFGPLRVDASARWTNVAAGFAMVLEGVVGGAASASVWDFGDGIVLSNRLCAEHSWTSPGEYAVVLRAYNADNPGGVSGTVMVRVVSRPVRYVAADSERPAAPYDSWATAAQNIQEAVDGAVPGSLILVSNGVYACGGRAVYPGMTNRVAVDRPVEVRSANGPEVTVIQGFQVPETTNGYGAIRCVYLTNGAVLSGFTLRQGGTWASGSGEREESGGGLWCESAEAVATNCVLSGNSAAGSGGGAYDGTLDHCTLAGNWASSGGGAYSATLNNCTLRGNSAGDGGGAMDATLNNCTLTGNWALWEGGGVDSSTLNNCTVVSNEARRGGGAANSTLNNCIVCYNTAQEDTNYWGRDVNYSCTVPLPDSGAGNIASEPLFMDLAGGDLRLQSGSPCINIGNNTYVVGGTDLDGNPRVVCDTVDMGAYEFQGCGTAKPVLTNLPLTQSGAFQLRVTGLQGPGSFVLEMSTNLSTWMPVLTNTLPGTTLDYTDPAATNLPCRFYRGVLR